MEEFDFAFRNNRRSEHIARAAVEIGRQFELFLEDITIPFEDTVAPHSIVQAEEVGLFGTIDSMHSSRLIEVQPSAQVEMELFPFSGQPIHAADKSELARIHSCNLLFKLEK